jgi:hypothetical protein
MTQVLIQPEDWVKMGKVVDAAAHGPYFDDGEFETLLGVSREFARQVAAAWPAVDPLDHDVFVTINNALLHMLTYPHGRHERLQALIGVSVEEIGALFSVFRESTGGALPTDYLSALAG